jgi:2-amino-4-hydroxy-6-hydroxymethyldihydropteridine diphosphokinase
MPIVIATGTNLGNRKDNLVKAKQILSRHFHFLEESRIYESPAVDYLQQPDFYNQVLLFETPHFAASKVMQILLEIENEMGRTREILRGPRVIDLDLLFFDLENHNSDQLTLPHPRLFVRSFVVLPLRELSFYHTLENHFDFPNEFDNTATPIVE